MSLPGSHLSDQERALMIKRDQEIVRRWKLHLKYRVTFVQLSREYGISRQRVLQIVREA